MPLKIITGVLTNGVVSPWEASISFVGEKANIFMKTMLTPRRVDVGVYTRDDASPFPMQLNWKTRQIFWTAHMSRRHVQTPLVKIIMVSWCTDVALLSSSNLWLFTSWVGTKDQKLAGGSGYVILRRMDGTEIKETALHPLGFVKCPPGT